MSGRVPLRVGPEHVGSRVVLRRRAPGGRFVDLLGELVAWSDGVARVRTRTGEASVPISAIIAGKPVPPPPTRRGAAHLALSLAALEDVAADGWRPLELTWLGLPAQGWRLRAADGFTGRANSVLAVGDPGLPLPAAVDEAERWYAERGLPARFAVPWPLDATLVGGTVAGRVSGTAPAGTEARDTALDAELRARGYQLDTPTLVLTAATRDVAATAGRPGTPPLGTSLRLDLADEPDDGWLGVYRYRGQQLPAVARRVLLSAPAQTFVSVRHGESTVAVGRGASSRGWTGVTAMQVAASYQRGGLGRAVLGALAAWALERGDRAAYLQVAETNVVARRLYESVGFTPHHGYQYRIAPRA